MRVDAAGARYPVTVDPLIQQGGKLTGSGETAEGLFGWSVALSADGNTALVGGPGDNEQLGAAWVFTRSGTTWTQQGAKLTAAGESAKGFFGSAVALSSDGNTAMIGAPEDKSKAGSVRVFTRSGTSWGETQALEAGANSEFGASVAISRDGSTAVIGAPAFEEGEGAISVLKSSGGKWSFLTGLDGCEKRKFPPGTCIEREEETAPPQIWRAGLERRRLRRRQRDRDRRTRG